MPDLPLRMLSQARATVDPTGETMPRPVTTTRRRFMRCLRWWAQPATGRTGAWRPRLRGLAAVRLDVVEDVLEGHDLLGFLVRDVDLELFFERHHQFDGVQRVGAKVFDERGLRRDLVFADAQ